MYGFHKVDDPSGNNSKHFEFKNSNFVPGRRELLKKIERRKAVKRSTKNNEEDPAGKQQAFTAATTTSAPNNNGTRKGSSASISSSSLPSASFESKPEPVHHQGGGSDICLFMFICLYFNFILFS
jgi:hypothetical protein